ncbi:MULTISPECIES: type II toxin-antitoxin system RelE/ParE family toxin [unclassified Anabaena]|uniref:type II toxin-antitoxin system RelE/ParE family toxin n=1 Tax=unclassified Anabaena TaxID=2619674 RepID=UPI001445C5E9|nr:MULTISPECIES: type II toxin-antitoxin system RelE/ParE family toxin [unclassified Anabaena]MTJ06928.1 type II toxin-antitoxin system RelE/ParE family toxin [Anabaena sp. UHCC 0204]MTJ54835.1 type II toxin-antitoxin system RelE/ParE family toxin [Anabaena sp. UHCC 0253]
MGKYSFSDEAIQDLEEICEYLGNSNPKAASQLFDKIRSKCKLVASFPSMGKSYGRLAKNLRGFVVDDYIIFYYPQEEKMEINITRIASGYRDLESLFD